MPDRLGDSPTPALPFPTNHPHETPDPMIRFILFAVLALSALGCHLAGCNNLALTLAGLAAFELLLALEQAAARVELPSCRS
jgi:hypothetical protein